MSNGIISPLILKVLTKCSASRLSCYTPEETAAGTN